MLNLKSLLLTSHVVHFLKEKDSGNSLKYKELKIFQN